MGTAADAPAKRLFVAAVVGGVVQLRTRTNGKWSGWSVLGSGYTGAPAVASLGQGNVAVVSRTGKNVLQVRFFRGKKWAAWVRLPGAFVTSPTAAALAGGRIAIAAADSRGVLRTTTLAPGGKPSAWRATSLRTATTAGLAVNAVTKTWHLLARAGDGTVAEQRSANGGLKWTAPVRIGSGAATGVGVTANSGGQLDAVALDATGRLLRAGYNGRNWGLFQIVEPLVVAPATAVLPGAAVASVSGEPTGPQTVAIDDPGAVPQPGEIIVASSTTAAPNGLLAKVVSVDKQADGTATVTTAPAKLTEAVPSGSINVPITLSAADVVQPPGRGSAAAADPLDQRISKNFTCSGSVSASITGSVRISPAFELNASWNVSHGVEEVTFTGGVTEDASLRAAIDAQASCRLSPTPLLDDPIRFRPIVFLAGPIPIVITPELQLYLDASGEVTASVAVEARQKAEATAGLRWKGGAIGPIAKLSNTFTYTPPTPAGTLSLEAGVAPKFSFLLYGVAGPRLDTRVHVRLDADSAADPAWTLRAGITAGVELVVPQLDIAQGKSDVIKFEKVLAQGAPTVEPPAGMKVITTAADNWAECREDDKWSFFLSDAGGAGVPVPESISAKIKGGGTLTIPVTSRSTTPVDLSYYRIASSAKLTGEATAVIRSDWAGGESGFMLNGGPCAPSVTTISASKTTAKTKTKVTLSGRIRTSAGAGLGQQPLTIFWHSARRDGKGYEINIKTKADGTFTTAVTVDDIGKHTFRAEYNGSGPLGAALERSSATVSVAVTR